MHISKESSGVEYEMSNKQRVINEIFSEKAKKSWTFFRVGKLTFFQKSMS